MQSKPKAVNPKRSEKLMFAKQDAQKDITKYRTKKEEAYKAERAQMHITMKEVEETMAKEGNKSGEIERDFNANKDKVIDELLQKIMTVNLEVPRVVKQDFE
jgi:hypothetical protein